MKLRMPTTDADLLYLPPTAEARFLPEGPTALGEGKFSWVAIQHGPAATSGSLNVFDLPSGQNRAYDLPGRPGFAKPTQHACVFVVGCERALGIYRTDTQTWEVLVDGVDQDVTNTIINDGTAFGDNLIFGTKDLEFKTPKAGLYLYRGSDRRLIRLRNDQTCSNGKAVISAGGHLQLIDIDTPTRRVMRYRLDLAGGGLDEGQSVIDRICRHSRWPGGDSRRAERHQLLRPEPGRMVRRGNTVCSRRLEAVWRTPRSPQATCPLLIETSAGRVQLVITRRWNT